MSCSWHFTKTVDLGTFVGNWQGKYRNNDPNRNVNGTESRQAKPLLTIQPNQIKQIKKQLHQAPATLSSQTRTPQASSKLVNKLQTAVAAAAPPSKHMIIIERQSSQGTRPNSPRSKKVNSTLVPKTTPANSEPASPSVMRFKRGSVNQSETAITMASPRIVFTQNDIVGSRMATKPTNQDVSLFFDEMTTIHSKEASDRQQ